MGSQKNNTKKLILAILILMIIALTTLLTINSNNYKEVNEKYTLNEQKINILNSKMDSLSQKSLADELFINGYYDSAMQAYERIPGKQQSESFIENRKNIREQMRDFRLSLQMQADSATTQSEFRQTLLEMKTAALETEYAEKTDSLYKALSREIKSLEDQLSKKEKQLSKASNIDRLSFYNTKGTKINYFGEVKNGKANGEGIGNHSTGSVYDGEWKNNQKHGKGTYKWPEGEVYKGEFENDKIKGSGTYYWVNGDRYEGEWANNRRNGEGTLYDKDNKVVLKGIWKDDEFVQAIN